MSIYCEVCERNIRTSGCGEHLNTRKHMKVRDRKWRISRGKS